MAELVQDLFRGESQTGSTDSSQLHDRTNAEIKQTSDSPCMRWEALPARVTAQSTVNPDDQSISTKRHIFRSLWSCLEPL